MVYSMDSSCCVGGVGNRAKRRCKNAEAHHFVFVSIITLSYCLLLFAIVSVSVVDFANAETSTSSSSKRKRRNLIVNGDTVNPSEFQFFLRSWPDSVPATRDVLCGASLIHSDIILTAAHCQGGFNYGAMAYDPSTGQFNRYKTVDLQIAFPDYYSNLDVINYDLMILRLSKPITDVKPVMINGDPDFPINNSTSSPLDALGFGLTEDGTVAEGLKAGHFTPITNDQCFQRLQIANVDLSDDILCVDPLTDDSICAGDSGGPLTASITDSNNKINMVQVGVVSFGSECEPDWVPDGFARVSYFNDWINKRKKPSKYLYGTIKWFVIVLLCYRYCVSFSLRSDYIPLTLILIVHCYQQKYVIIREIPPPIVMIIINQFCTTNS
jgi:secreted trypsin-like serine protease